MADNLESISDRRKRLVNAGKRRKIEDWPLEQRQKKFCLSSISDEEINELMESVIGPDDSDFDDDDSVKDPDYILEEITPENEEHIDEFLNTMNSAETSSAFIQDIGISLDNSLLELSSIVLDTSVTVAGDETPTTSNKSKNTSIGVENANRKRPRSPLPEYEEGGPPVSVGQGGFTAQNLTDIDKQSREFKNILWRKNSMQHHVNEVAFRGNAKLPDKVACLETPFEFFKYFFTEEIIEFIVEQTNSKALSEDVGTKLHVDSEMVHHYIGLLVYMSVNTIPNTRWYWGKFQVDKIKNVMPLRKFEEIKRYMCFSNERERVRRGEEGYDSLFRIRTLLNKLNERFDSIPKTARLCIDEQMCSTKIKHHLRQYMPNKPHKWGVKLFVLCDTSGYSYRFEIFNGSGDNVVVPGNPDLGATANVVVRLSQTIPDFVHHIVYFDNFYTTLPLLVYLRARGIYSLGTVRANRVPNCKLPSDKDLEVTKAPRGYSTEYVATAYGIDLSTVLWKDTKCVRLVSTYVGITPFSRSSGTPEIAKTSRYDRQQKKYIEVDCPQIIREYNAHMGGVDLMDGLMGRYKITLRSRDVMTRLFYHFVDMAITNSYILYKRANFEKQSDPSRPQSDERLLTLPEFRMDLAAALCAYTEKRPVGRPPTTQEEPQQSSILRQRAQHPVADVRYDGLHHIPKWLAKTDGKRKCKAL